jgi:hypothetical protein
VSVGEIRMHNIKRNMLEGETAYRQFQMAVADMVVNQPWCTSWWCKSYNAVSITKITPVVTKKGSAPTKKPTPGPTNRQGQTAGQAAANSAAAAAGSSGRRLDDAQALQSVEYAQSPTMAPSPPSRISFSMLPKGLHESMNISCMTLLKVSQPGGDSTAEELLKKYVLSVQERVVMTKNGTNVSPPPGPILATERKLAGAGWDDDDDGSTGGTGGAGDNDDASVGAKTSEEGAGNSNFNPNSWETGLTVTEDGGSGDLPNADALDVQFAMDLGTVEEAQTSQELFEQESFAVQLNMQLRRVALRMGTLETLPGNVYATNEKAREEMSTRRGDSLLMENEVELNQLQEAYELEEEAAKVRAQNDTSGMGLLEILLIIISIFSCGGFLGYRHHMIKVCINPTFPFPTFPTPTPHPLIPSPPYSPHPLILSSSLSPHPLSCAERRDKSKAWRKDVIRGGQEATQDATRCCHSVRQYRAAEEPGRPPFFPPSHPPHPLLTPRPQFILNRSAL